MNRVRETNDWLLPEELALPGAVLVLFDLTEGLRDTAAYRFAAERHEGPARFFRVNVDENPSVLKAYKVRKLPTVVLFIEGVEAARRSGPLGDQDILDLLAKPPRKR